MTKQTIKDAAKKIDECGDKVAFLRTLFKYMRDTHPDASFIMGLEKIWVIPLSIWAGPKQNHSAPPPG